ncbi:hypothetical protein Nepgr_030893 [Nepenthes gracilis]|uniref:Uncharacterized protein n=1 Tax=Nepenthes gracilis TaxID=150966 RepID=A0AAD3TGA4_NEPGR|nr:hypothetical protein Nepgr_030893 [Nepenthes gracilis]
MMKPTGKKCVATRIHHHKNRPRKPVCIFHLRKEFEADPNGRHSSEWPVRQTGIERAFTQLISADYRSRPASHSTPIRVNFVSCRNKSGRNANSSTAKTPSSISNIFRKQTAAGVEL